MYVCNYPLTNNFFILWSGRDHNVLKLGKVYKYVSNGRQHPTSNPKVQYGVPRSNIAKWLERVPRIGSMMIGSYLSFSFKISLTLVIPVRASSSQAKSREPFKPTRI